MVEKWDDQVTRKAKAEILLGSTASELREMLREASTELDPFPFFLSSLSIRAIEAEPGAAARADRGCVVVCPDGALYEYSYAVAVGGPFPEPLLTEEVRELDLPHQDYIPYAYNALCEVERQIADRKGSS